jgi:hypothetical protein
VNREKRPPAVISIPLRQLKPWKATRGLPPIGAIWYGKRSEKLREPVLGQADEECAMLRILIRNHAQLAA